MFHDNANVLRLVGNDNFKTKSPADMLKAYRRGVRYLRKYNEFEILKCVYFLRKWDDGVEIDIENRLTPPESLKGNTKKGTWDWEGAQDCSDIGAV